MPELGDVGFVLEKILERSRPQFFLLEAERAEDKRQDRRAFVAPAIVDLCGSE